MPNEERSEVVPAASHRLHLWDTKAYMSQNAKKFAKRAKAKQNQSKSNLCPLEKPYYRFRLSGKPTLLDLLPIWVLS